MSCVNLRFLFNHNLPPSATPRKSDRPSRRKDLREAPGPRAPAADLLPGIMWLPSALTVGICASSSGAGCGAQRIAHSASFWQRLWSEELLPLEVGAQLALQG